MGEIADPGGGAVDGSNADLLVILNRLEQSSTEEAREADEIDEQPRVIIAGFGRFDGTGRLLLSSGVKMVVLNHNPDHIETLRKFGMKVFYGDATRMDLLESAGAAKAEVLINAIDNPQTNLQLTEMVKEHFRICRLLPRPRCQSLHSFASAGVEKPERETFEGALKTGRLALESLGLGRMKRENVPMCSAALIFRWWKRWQWLRMTPKPARRSINAPARC